MSKKPVQVDEEVIPPDLNLLQFIGSEQTNLLVSMTQLRQEFDLFAHVDALYQTAVRVAQVPPSSTVPMQLLVFCHYHLYFSFTTLLRCHLSDAFSSVRTAIEAALHAFRILNGRGTVDQYIERDKTFLHTVNHIRNMLKQDPAASPLAAHLLKNHEACSQYASHADFDAFAHRLELVRGDPTMIKVHYFQKPEKTPEFQLYAIAARHPEGHSAGRVSSTLMISGATAPNDPGTAINGGTGHR